MKSVVNKIELNEKSLHYIKENQPIEYNFEDLRERVLSFNPPDDAFKKSTNNDLNEQSEIQVVRKRNVSLKNSLSSQ